MTCKCAKTLTSGLTYVGLVRLPGGCPRDPSYRWLEETGNVAQYSSRWLSFTRNLSSLEFFHFFAINLTFSGYIFL